MCNQGLVVGRILQRSVQLPDMPSLLQRGDYALVHERQQDVALLVDTVLIRGLAKVGKEIGQDLVAIIWGDRLGWSGRGALWSACSGGAMVVLS